MYFGLNVAVILGVPCGSGYSLQTFFAQKAQKGFPLLSLTQIELRYLIYDFENDVFKC
jgi:hypothetical protein